MGKMKAIVILGENPVVSDADCHHVEKALKALDFLLVIDIFKTPYCGSGPCGFTRSCLCRKRGNV